MASAALSTRFTTTRWNCSRSTFTGGRPGAKLVANLDAVQAPVKYQQRFRDHLVQIAAHGLRRGEARELRELVHQRLHRFHRSARWWRRTRAECGRRPAAGRRRSSWRPMRSARKRDRRQRILDLVRDAARHLVPRRGLLRAQQFAGVFEHHHEAGGAASLRAPRPSPRGAILRLSVRNSSLPRRHAGAPRALHQVLDLGGVFAREQIFQARGARDRLAPGRSWPARG